MVVIYTDGGCWPNPGAGGWGAVIMMPTGGCIELAGGENPSSNNRMELMAPIRALEYLRESCTVKVYSDSEYVVNGITRWLNGWRARGWLTKAKQPVKNRELWERLDIARSRHDVTFEWLRGHSGIEGNERADGLSQRGAQELSGQVIDFSKFRYA